MHKVSQIMFWGCFACNNGHIPVRQKKCPTCRRPRSLDKFGLIIHNYGYFLCSVRTANLLLKLSAYRIPTSEHSQMAYHDLPFFADATDEDSWKVVARDTIMEHINKPIKSISLNISIPLPSEPLVPYPSQTPPPPPPGTSLYDQIIYNASLHTPHKRVKMESATPQSTRHHHHSRTPLSKRTPKGKGSNPTAGFRYLQQMKNEQVAIKKMVQAVLDKRNRVDEGYSLAQLDRDLPAPTDKRIPCALCDYIFPVSQLVGKISLQAVCNWKTARNVPIDSNEHAYSDEKSAYLRALDSVKRLQTVSLCVFCTQFFDADMGDYIEPELIKQDVGVEDIVKGPLNRPSHIYKKLLRSFMVSKTRAPNHSDSHTYSVADTHSKVPLDRPQSRENYEDKVRNLKFRSVQKVVTLAQARTIKNKYVSVDKIMESLESVGQKSKRAHSVDSPLRIERRYVPLISVSDILAKSKKREKSRGKSQGRSPSPGHSKLFLSRDSRDAYDMHERKFFLTTAEEASSAGGMATLATVPEERVEEGERNVKKTAGRGGVRSRSRFNHPRARSHSPALASSLLTPSNNSVSSSHMKRRKDGKVKGKKRAATLSPPRRSSRSSLQSRLVPTPNTANKPQSAVSVSPQKRRGRSVGWSRRRDRSAVRGSKRKEASKKPIEEDKGEKEVPNKDYLDNKSSMLSNPPSASPSVESSVANAVSTSSTTMPTVAPKPRAQILFAIQKKKDTGGGGDNAKDRLVTLTTSLSTPIPIVANPVATSTNQSTATPSDFIPPPTVKSALPEGEEKNEGVAEAERVDLPYPVITGLRGKNKFKLLRRKQLEDREKAALMNTTAFSADLPTIVPNSVPSIHKGEVIYAHTTSIPEIKSPVQQVKHESSPSYDTKDSPAPVTAIHSLLSPSRSKSNQSVPLTKDQILDAVSSSPPGNYPASTTSPNIISRTQESPSDDYADDFERYEGVGVEVRDSFQPTSPLPFRLPSRRGGSMRESGEGMRLLSRGQIVEASENDGSCIGSESVERIDLLSPATRPHSSSVRTPSQRTRSRGGVTWEVRKMQVL